MTSSLFQLVYYSRNRLGGTPEALSEAINQILSKSRANNEAVDVSGALMFNAGCFGQVLEGPRGAIEQTFERIQQDPRHGDVSVLAFGPIEKRSFARWSMGFVGSAAADGERYGHIAGASGFEFSRMTGDRLHETLVGLIREEEQAAA